MTQDPCPKYDVVDFSPGASLSGSARVGFFAALCAVAALGALCIDPCGIAMGSPPESPWGSPPDSRRGLQASAGQCASGGNGHRFRGSGWLDFPVPSQHLSGADLADVNGDGVPDAVVSLRPDPTGSDPPRLQTYLGEGPLCFTLREERTVSLHGRVLLEDVTGDEVVDAILVQVEGDGGYDVLRGRGDGSFEDLASHSFGTWIEEPAQVLVLDVDGDGHRDIVSAGRPPFIAYGPSFGPPAYLESGSQAASGAVPLDADGDGHLDLLVSLSDWQRPFSLLVQGPARAFQRHAILGGGAGPLYAVGRDGEGRTEVLARTAEGFSTFVIVRPQDAWEAEETPLTVDERPLAAHLLGDVDGDGREDLVALFQDGLLEVRFAEAPPSPEGPGDAGRAARGGGAALAWEETAVTVAPTFGSPRPTALRDIDGDGLRDILFGRGYVLCEETRDLVAAKIVAEPIAGEEGATIDLNGDGYRDLLRIVPREMRTYLGGSGGLVEAARKSFVDTVYSFAVGRPDPGGRPVLALGTFEAIQAAEILPDGSLSQLSVVSPSAAHGLAFVDWGEGQGDRLLAFLRNSDGVVAGCSILEPRGGGSFVETGSFFVPWPIRFPTAVDLDSDGDRDLVLMGRRGASIIRGGAAAPGGAGGFAPYLATVRLPWDSVRTAAALDLEGDGVFEIVAGQTHPSAALLIHSGAGGDWSSGKISSRQISSGEVNFLAAADLDGDGRTDVVDDARYCAEVFLNDGRGGLALPPAVIPGGGGYRTEAPLAVLDLDGDGRLDVVRNRTVTFGIPRGLAGGPVGGAVPLGELGSPEARLDFGDFDGDGLVDLLATHEWRQAEIHLGGAGGTFGATAPLAGPDTRTYGTELGDFDGDGKLDIAARIVTVEGISWFRGKGDGTFEVPAKLPGAGQTIVAASDIVGDGNVGGGNAGGGSDAGAGASELLVLGSSGGVLLHRGGAGFGSEEPSVLAAAIRSDAAAGIADLDADGRRDLVLRGEDSASRVVQLIFPGREDGSLEDPLPLAEPDLLQSGSLLADIDGDGFADSLRMEGRALYLVKGRGDFTFTLVPLGELAEAFAPSALRDVDGDGLLDILGIDSYRGRCIARARPGGGYDDPVFFSPMTEHFVVDANGDGLPDMVVVRYVSSQAGTIHAILASRDHLLEGSRDFLFLLGRAASGDLEPGGGSELALYEPAARSVSIVVSGASRRLAVARTAAAPAGLSRDAAVFPEIADYDGDGRRDLLLLADGTLYGYRNLGGLELAAPAALVDDVPGYALAAPDLDRDGVTDLLVSGFSVALGLGGGTFGAPRSYGVAPPWGPPALLGDFDGDGILDVADGLGGAVFLLAPGDGEGGFRAMELLSAGGLEAAAMAVGDFDGDGLGDVTLGVYGSGAGSEGEAGRVWYGREGGTFERGESLHDPVRVDDGARGLAAADLNDDGTDDVVAVDPRGYALTYFGGPEGLGGAAGVTVAPGEPRYVFAGNFAGDAAADLLVAGPNGVLLTLGEEPTGPVQAAFERGDPNADGTMDIGDPVFVLRWLFLAGRAPPCLDAADANDSGSVDIDDAVHMLAYLYLGTVPPPGGPFPGCGEDPTADDLGCEAFPACG